MQSSLQIWPLLNFPRWISPHWKILPHGILPPEKNLRTKKYPPWKISDMGFAPVNPAFLGVFFPLAPNLTGRFRIVSSIPVVLLISGASSGDFLKKKVWKILIPIQNLNCTQKGNRKVGQKRFIKKKENVASPLFKTVNFFHLIYLRTVKTSLSYWKSHSKQLWLLWLTLQVWYILSYGGCKFSNFSSSFG